MTCGKDWDYEAGAGPSRRYHSMRFSYEVTIP